jgi:CBS domain-containing protein
MAQKVAEIMSSTPVALAEHATLHDAARLMRDEGIGDVLVNRNDGGLYGVVTDRDIVIRALAEGKDPEHTQVSEICSPKVVTLSPDDTADKAIHTMREHSLRRIPVVEGDRVVGVVALADLAIDRDEQSTLANISAAKPNT